MYKRIRTQPLSPCAFFTDTRGHSLVLFYAKQSVARYCVDAADCHHQWLQTRRLHTTRMEAYEGRQAGRQQEAESWSLESSMSKLEQVFCRMPLDTFVKMVVLIFIH